MNDEQVVCAVAEGTADLNFIDAALDALERLWQDAHFVPESDRGLFMLALSEVVTNIVQHSERTICVRVELEATPRELRAMLQDWGPGVAIDWEAVGLPNHLSESGRGLALSLQVLDELRHEPSSAGNQWHLLKRIAVD